MVFAGRVSLGSMALRRRPSNALRRPGPRRDASGRRLVVREYSALSLARRDRARHRLLHDPESDRAPGLQLSSSDDWILDLRVVLELDWDAAPCRWTIPGMDDYSEHRCNDPDHHSGRDRRTQSSHDDAGIFSGDALQPDAAVHRLRRDVVYGL